MTVVVFENGTPVAQFVFDCDNIAKAIYSEPSSGGTDGNDLIRGRPLFEIVDFATKKPCTPKALTIPKGMTGGAARRDNEQWPTPEPHPGSGALCKLSVPSSSITALGCKAACWSQTVTTTISRYDPASDKWTALHRDKPHIDAENADPGPNGEPWYCYDDE